MRRLLSCAEIRIFHCLFLALCVLASWGLPLFAQDNVPPAPTVNEAIRFAVSEPLRDVAKLPRQHYELREIAPVHDLPKYDSAAAEDPVVQRTLTGAPSTDYSVGLDVLGVGNGFPGFTVTIAPPDTNMAVGDTQIVQWVNYSFAVLDKFDGSTLAGPIYGNLLFTALGGPCATYNDGSTIAQWDNAAHRWLLSQNVLHGPPYYACVAVSTSADALGTYYVYQFPLGNNFPDYQKWGRWNTTWSQTMNGYDPGSGAFIGPQVCLYERSRLLAGSPPPRQVCFLLSAQDDTLLPADIDSVTSPPSAECQFFIGSLGNTGNNHLSLYSACIDWTHPSLAYITGNHNSQTITVPTYIGSCGGGGYGGNCVPQEGTTVKLQSDGKLLMYRFAYYNETVPGKQHWYVNHDVQVSNTSSQIGVRWYEFQAPQIAITPPGLTLFQSGTYAPDMTNDRWMGSIAGDMNNDILVGYSESSASTYPSIEVAGRLKSSPAGTLEPEVPVVAGAGAQTGGRNQWGHYSAMRLDPDGCTFWYTTEYYTLTAAQDWSTQIANVRFAGCHNAAYDGYMELCKQSDPDYPVNGTFNFTLTAPFFSYGPVGVPVGSCSPPIEVPSGEITINEAPQIGVAVENVTAYSYDQFGNYIDELDSWTPPNLTATVSVMPGGVNLETIATFTNYAAPPGQLKICKVAGTRDLVDMPFTFNVTGIAPVQIPAGPPPGGSCQIVGSFPVNMPVTVTEAIPTGVNVYSITVNPPDRGGPSNLQGGYITVTIGTGITEVDFTDVTTITPGSCQPSESLSVMVNPNNVSGNSVVAFVPLSHWIYAYDQQGTPGVAVVSVEGTYIPSQSPLSTGSDFINSCAATPLTSPPQAVCTSNNGNVWVFEDPAGNGNWTESSVDASGGLGLIGFSGGCCTACGVAMDAAHSQAVITLAIGGTPADYCGTNQAQGWKGSPGFQFLTLTNGFGVSPTLWTPIKSTAYQVSEDVAIDPTRQRLLSATEGTTPYGDYCYPHGTPLHPCIPKYEIADITYPGGVPTLSFYDRIFPKGDGSRQGIAGGSFDSAAADCSQQIALATVEYPGNNGLRPFFADLSKATFTTGSPGSWIDSFPNSQFLPLGVNPPTPPLEGIAIAQGTGEGVLSQEFSLEEHNNPIVAFKLSKPPYSVTNSPVAAWVQCDLGTNPNNGQIFYQGDDPHTVTAYQSPGGYQYPKGEAIAVIANADPSTGAATALAVVDLDKMLALPATNNVCNMPLPPSVVTFIGPPI